MRRFHGARQLELGLGRLDALRRRNCGVRGLHALEALKL